MSEHKKAYYHVIRERYCKGCNICVAFCPKQVLVLREGKVFAEKHQLCIGCRMCELRCPDFAIEVQEKAQASEAEVDEMDFTLPPEARHA